MDGNPTDGRGDTGGGSHGRAGVPVEYLPPVGGGDTGGVPMGGELGAPTTTAFINQDDDGGRPGSAVGFDEAGNCWIPSAGGPVKISAWKLAQWEELFPELDVPVVLGLCAHKRALASKPWPAGAVHERVFAWLQREAKDPKAPRKPVVPRRLSVLDEMLALEAQYPGRSRQELAEMAAGAAD